MSQLLSQPEFVTAPYRNASASPWTFQLKGRCAPLYSPVSQQAITWLLFWPLLTLIARQTVYFSGPARAAAVYQSGADMAGGRAAHYHWYVYIFILLGFVLAGYRQVWAVLRRNQLIPAMLVLSVCSALWSVAPIITLQMCIQAGLCTLFACYLSMRLTPERLMGLITFVGAIAAVLSVLFALFLPSYGLADTVDRAWQGISAHKNDLGASMAVLFTTVFFTNSYSRSRRALYAGLLLLVIYKSQSRGAWCFTAAIIAFVALLSLTRRVRARELAPLLLTTAAFLVVIVAFGVHFWPLIARSIGKDPSMTGRAEVYAEVWRSIIRRPILGYGFGAFWDHRNPEFQRIGLALRWPNIGYAESGVLDLALQTGFLGVILVVAMITRAALQGLRLLRSPYYSPRVGWYLTILFLVAVTNIDAGWFMTVNTLDWVLLLVACIGMNEEMRILKATEAHGRSAVGRAEPAMPLHRRLASRA
jgi:exopolysaccharide production protein ExoQ